MTSYVYRIGFPSGHYYIGVKKGAPNKTKSYVGSPKTSKWMWDEFPVVCKEVLWVTETFEEALEIEKSVLIGLDYSRDCLNLNFNCGGHIPIMKGEDHPMFGKPGGMMGKTHPNKAKLQISVSQTEDWKTNSDRREKAAERMKKQWEDRNFCDKVSFRMSETNKKLWNDSEWREQRVQSLRETMSGENNPFYGQSHTESSRVKMVEAWIARREKGVSDETKNKLSEAAKRQPTRKCPHCEVTGKGANMTRYHFDNCKEKKD